MEEEGGDEDVGNILVIDRDGVANHGERMDDVGLSVATGLTFVMFHHVTEGTEADLHTTADENAPQESHGRINILEATDEIRGREFGGGFRRRSFHRNTFFSKN